MKDAQLLGPVFRAPLCPTCEGRGVIRPKAKSLWVLLEWLVQELCHSCNGEGILHEAWSRQHGSWIAEDQWKMTADGQVYQKVLNNFPGKSVTWDIIDVWRAAQSAGKPKANVLQFPTNRQRAVRKQRW